MLGLTVAYRADDDTVLVALIVGVRPNPGVVDLVVFDPAPDAEAPVFFVRDCKQDARETLGELTAGCWMHFARR